MEEIKRKVRKEFDTTAEYSVDVSDCTEEKKKEVQQAFFDVGILWLIGGETYLHLDVVKYSNVYRDGVVTYHLLHGCTTDSCNMTAKEFLALVYESEQKGHPHAELMAQYAEDARTHTEPWKLWELRKHDDDWLACSHNPGWYTDFELRRKPKTHLVNGVEVPDLRITPEHGDKYYLASTSSRTYFNVHVFGGDSLDEIWGERGLIYPFTEEGKQATILHTKAMLGIVNC